MKKLLLELFTWMLWKNFHWGLKSVLGHKTLSSSIKEMHDIEIRIRQNNNLNEKDAITWENSKMTNREIFAKYVTLRHFNQVGELLALFRAMDKKRILEENYNGR